MKKTLLTVKTISSVFALGIVCVIGHPQLSQAQGVTASISSVQSGSDFDYTIILNNPSGSAPVETFWFDWTPGKFYLEVNPASTGEPSGWSVSDSSSSIEYNTSTAPLEPGSSDTFTFVSTEAPASVFADSNQGANDSSTTYTGSTAFSSSPDTFNVTAVPEPSSISLMVIGLTGAILARKLRFSL